MQYNSVSMYQPDECVQFTNSGKVRYRRCFDNLCISFLHPIFPALSRSLSLFISIILFILFPAPSSHPLRLSLLSSHSFACFLSSFTALDVALCVSAPNRIASYFWRFFLLLNASYISIMNVSKLLKTTHIHNKYYHQC